MKLTKLLDYSLVQHYLIENPSAKFKKKYPKRFIYAFREGSRVLIGNDDKIPTAIALHRLPGYVFTYSRVSLTNVFVNIPYPPEQETTRYPTIENLDRVFVQGYDIAVSFVHDRLSPVGMPVDSMDLAFTIKDFMSIDLREIERYIKDGYVGFVTSSIRNTEEWVELILELVPMTRFERAPCFPRIITDKSFEESQLRKDFNLRNLYLTYDVHAHNNAEEFAIAHKMDELMIDPSFKITVEDDYTDLANRFKKMIKKPVKTTKNSITFTFKDYCEIKNGNFTITDCI